MRRHITNRMFLCEGCGRPIDPVRDDWIVDEDGACVCGWCYEQALEEAIADCKAGWREIEADILQTPETDLEIRRF